MPHNIKDEDDIIIAVKNIHSLSTVPIFYVSSVTGEGLGQLRTFLNIFPKRNNIISADNKVEFYVDQTFQVTGVGTVVGGQLTHGKIRIGDELIVGPDNNTYSRIQVKSIHCKRVSVDEADSGCYVCLGIKKPEISIRRGHIILSTLDEPIQVSEFEAEIVVLKSHSTTIKIGYEPVVHACSIRQTAKIMSITPKKNNTPTAPSVDLNPVLRTGDRAIVKFKFCYKPEYLRKGYRILLAEGRVKIIGKITSCTNEVIKIN